VTAYSSKRVSWRWRANSKEKKDDDNVKRVDANYVDVGMRFLAILTKQTDFLKRTILE